MSWAVIRTRPPALRTLPSRTWLTPSWCATSLTFGDLPLKPKAVLRATTDRAETLERSVMMSSLIPSLKYSCCGSSLMLANGSTQIDSLRTAGTGVGAVYEVADAGDDLLPVVRIQIAGPADQIRTLDAVEGSWQF